MSRSRQNNKEGNKESKKQATMSLKEKRSVRKAKKDVKDTIQPFLPR